MVTEITKVPSAGQVPASSRANRLSRPLSWKMNKPASRNQRKLEIVDVRPRGTGEDRFF
jgi:hypothetical protein